VDTFEYGKRSDPTLHFRKHKAKHILTKEAADRRIRVVKQLMKVLTLDLSLIVFIDEATGPWVFGST